MTYTKQFRKIMRSAEAAAVLQVGKTLLEFRHQLDMSQSKLALLNKLHKKRTGLGLGLSRKSRSERDGRQVGGGASRGVWVPHGRGSGGKKKKKFPAQTRARYVIKWPKKSKGNLRLAF